MTSQDIRWIQRLNHFTQALGQLTKFIQKGALNELEKQGVIQAFEYTYELAWNTMKDYFESLGETDLLGSRDVIRLAFKRGLIQEGEIWMDMLKSRTLTSHTYNENLAEEIAASIVQRYFSEFVALQTKMDLLRKDTP
jgi:nucleotidyltransferase substrate binding protein (TIGR01987 family)